MNDSSKPDSLQPPQTLINKTAIENILGLSFTGNNGVSLLESGKNIFRMIIDCIKSAKDIICIEFYIFNDDATGNAIAELLKEKAGQGVKIYLLYDHYGSFFTSRHFWADLRKAGINVRVSHPFRWSAYRGYIYRNHKKLLVIDGEKAFIGGVNIADEYYGHNRKKLKTWRDIGIYLEGALAQSLLSIFIKSWQVWKGDKIRWDKKTASPAGNVDAIPIFSSSGKSRRRMRRLLIYSIRNSQDSIFMTTAYFSPGRRIIRALRQAAKRGVKFKLILPGKSDVLSVYYAGRVFYTRLLKAGVEIYDYHGSVLHSKAAVFDECWSIVGSTNLDRQSLRRNEESNVGIYDEKFGGQLIEVFHNDLKQSVKIELYTWLKRPLYQKILERFFYTIMKKL